MMFHAYFAFDGIVDIVVVFPYIFLSIYLCQLGPSGKIGGVGGRTHWELYLYSSHPVWFWGTGTHRGEPSEDRGKGIAP